MGCIHGFGFMHLVGNAIPEEPRHIAADIFDRREAANPGPISLPQRTVQTAPVLPPIPVRIQQLMETLFLEVRAEQTAIVVDDHRQATVGIYDAAVVRPAARDPEA